MERCKKAMSKRSTSSDAGLLSRFVRDDSGATAIEYALIASGISIVIASTVFSLGTTVKGQYTSVSTALK
jgi:pilus assembly protein Flp/PilA